MADDFDFPTKDDLERFRSELVEELKVTRDEVRQAFHDAAEPLRKDLPLILDKLSQIEDRVAQLEARQFEPWPKTHVC